MKQGNTKVITVLLLHVLLMIYSLSSVCVKYASQQEFLSAKFILFYGGMIAILGIYAICWQQVIKRIDLTLAFANKAVTVVWGIIWGFFLFDENITLGKIIGATLVIIGVIIYSFADGGDNNE